MTHLFGAIAQLRAALHPDATCEPSMPNGLKAAPCFSRRLELPADGNRKCARVWDMVGNLPHTGAVPYAGQRIDGTNEATGSRLA